MWLIAGYVLLVVLLLMSFALFLFSRIVEKRMLPAFFFSGSVLFFIAWLLAWKIECLLAWKIDLTNALGGFLMFFIMAPEVLAAPILRRRVIPPCIRVKTIGRSYVSTAFIIVCSVCILFSPYFPFVVLEMSPTFGNIVSGVGFTATLIILVTFFLYEKIEICGNGVWQSLVFIPWSEYEAFAWHRKTENEIELKLWPGRIQLTVPPERREAVYQLLAANLPELNPDGTNL
jgi:hypothetical protein